MKIVMCADFVFTGEVTPNQAMQATNSKRPSPGAQVPGSDHDHGKADANTLLRSAGFQPAVSQISNLQNVGSRQPFRNVIVPIPRMGGLADKNVCDTAGRNACATVLAAFLLICGHGALFGAAPAPSPRTTNVVDTRKAEKHWAFRPVQAPPVPKAKQKAWVRTPVDNFILARLEKQKLSPSGAADRATLIRRLSFDLLGLPPTLTDIRDFIQDTRTNAYELLVEKLLESPNYGERWGQHWLDVAGYADSNGYFDADSDRPLAWKYRDYVVRAFNADKPFDEFVREQIAGDEIAVYKPDGDITPDMVDKLVATHFLRNAPDGTGESDGNPLERTVDRYSVIEGTVQLIGSSLLGMTVQCAKCHDHKFEPISQEEYYQLQAILRPAYNPDKWLLPKERIAGVGTKAEREENKAKLAKYEKELTALKESQEGLLKPLRKLLIDEHLQGLPQETRAALTKALDKKEKDRSAEMKELLKKHAALVEVKNEELEKRFPDLAASIRASALALSKIEKQRPPTLPMISILTDSGAEVPRHHILVRGNYAKPGKEVVAGVPAAFHGDSFSLPTATETTGRRLAFAQWVTSPRHPTFARLAVNRIWQHHFGVGIVPTAENFGVTGAKPSHPELLDYLATEFVRSGWSTKALHRLIVNSAAYRQSGSMRADAYKADPEDRLLWRYPIQRLDAESIRDAMLAVTGELDHGIGVGFVLKAKTAEGEYVINENEPGARRRSLYLQQKRTGHVTFLDVFDSAKMSPNCVQRTQSTVALQSLTLLNSGFIRSRSKAFAERLLKEPQAERVDRAFEWALGRPPSRPEQAASADFLKKQEVEYNGKNNSELLVCTDFCQMLFASNPFLYVE
jgi:hypothetical protein